MAARELVDGGAHPLLAGRSAERLVSLSAELGGADTAVADAASPASVRSLLDEGDVLVTTVGPFARFGRPALEAAIAASAAYLDSAGEQQFVRTVFEEHDLRARSAGVGLVTAFGYDYVPGNLARALALSRAGDRAVRVDVGYCALGGGAGSMSGGSKASLAGAAVSRSFSWRGGRLQDDRPASRVRSFDVRGRSRAAVSVGGTEHFTLPRLAPSLLEVNVYFGWFGPLSRPMQAAAAVGSVVARLPGAGAALGGLGSRLVDRLGEGEPDQQEAEEGESYVLATAYDRLDEPLAEVRLSGPNGYVYTARMLSWGARRAAGEGLEGAGALGPVEAFGLDALVQGCAEAGLVESASSSSRAAP